MNYAEYFEHRYSKADPANWVCLAAVREAGEHTSDFTHQWDQKFLHCDDAEGMAAFVAKWRDTCNLYQSCVSVLASTTCLVRLRA